MQILSKTNINFIRWRWQALAVSLLVIAAAFLFQFGTGPIRGFATTLFFGLISNVFTAVFVSRTLFEFILSRKPAGATQVSI